MFSSGDFVTVAHICRLSVDAGQGENGWPPVQFYARVPRDREASLQETLREIR